MHNLKSAEIKQVKPPDMKLSALNIYKDLQTDSRAAFDPQHRLLFATLSVTLSPR